MTVSSRRRKTRGAILPTKSPRLYAVICSDYARRQRNCHPGRSQLSAQSPFDNPHTIVVEITGDMI